MNLWPMEFPPQPCLADCGRLVDVGDVEADYVTDGEGKLCGFVHVGCTVPDGLVAPRRTVRPSRRGATEDAASARESDYDADDRDADRALEHEAEYRAERRLEHD